MILLALLTALWSAALWAATDTTEDEADVLSIGGSVTEIVYALDQQHRLIARDTTSTYPPDASQLPDVGYMRALSPEGVLSVAPKLILSEEGAGPPETIELLEAASIPFITIKDDYSASGVVDKILAVGQALDVEPEAQKLADEVASALNTAVERSAMAERKRVLFILSTQGGRILASGTDTAADGIIRMAGGINAVSAFEGYKPMTDEAISLAAPDVILMMDRRGDHSTGDADLFAMPAIATTPAAATGSVVRMNGLYLLGFGPRTADAVTDLNTALYEHD
ncbi:ABC transporter substrate-binding protein [Actibacterium sp. 188UL27-1]|nr:ABC transporter substrate-binding protein [Actibacterium sp. 188UL27-1]